MTTLRCDEPGNWPALPAGSLPVEPGNRQAGTAGQQLAADHNPMIIREKTPVPWSATGKNAAGHNLLFTKEKTWPATGNPLYIQKATAGLLYRGPGKGEYTPFPGIKKLSLRTPHNWRARRPLRHVCVSGAARQDTTG